MDDNYDNSLGPGLNPNQSVDASGTTTGVIHRSMLPTATISYSGGENFHTQ